MNKKLSRLIDNAHLPRDKQTRNHIYIFLICLGISLFIWFLIKMSDEYVSEIRMPVAYQNAPENKLLLNADQHVYVRLRAKGGDIFSSKYFSKHSPLNINLNQAEIRKSRYFDKYYILTSHFRNQFSGRFDFAHSVLSLQPDTLFLDFEEVITKVLPVRAMVTLNCKPQFQLYDSLVLMPDRMAVSGPASIIDTMEFIRTESKQFSELDNDLQAEIPLGKEYKNELIRLERQTVELSADIEEYTESMIELEVSATTSDPGIRLKTFPETVELTYHVALKDFTLVKPGMFSLSATYNEQEDQSKTFLKVNVDNHPGFIRIKRINPDKLEYLIQKQ